MKHKQNKGTKGAHGFPSILFPNNTGKDTHTQKAHPTQLNTTQHTVSRLSDDTRAHTHTQTAYTGLGDVEMTMDEMVTDDGEGEEEAAEDRGGGAPPRIAAGDGAIPEARGGRPDAEDGLPIAEQNDTITNKKRRKHQRRKTFHIQRGGVLAPLISSLERNTSMCRRKQKAGNAVYGLDRAKKREKVKTNLAQELPFAAYASQLAERQLVSAALYEQQESKGEENPIQTDLRRSIHQLMEEEEEGLREDLMAKAFSLKALLLKAHQQGQEQEIVCRLPRQIHRKILV